MIINSQIHNSDTIGHRRPPDCVVVDKLLATTSLVAQMKEAGMKWARPIFSVYLAIYHPRYNYYHYYYYYHAINAIEATDDWP
jgi:hypothetical protein